MFERFTDRARRTLVLAQEEARLLNHSFIGTEHILLGLIHEGEGLAAKALESLDISLEAVRGQVEETIGPMSGSTSGSTSGSPPFTPRAKKVLELSMREALQLGHNGIGTEHMLLGLVRESEGAAATALKNLGVDLGVVRERVLSMLARGSSLDALSVRGLVPRPDYPTKTLPGPSVHIDSAGIDFSVTGVLIFDEAIEVFWQVSGIPKPIADLMKDTGESSLTMPPDTSAAYVMLTDDLDTDYSIAQASGTVRPDAVFVGRSRFTPVPPEDATRLNVIWQGEPITVEL